MVGEYAHGFLNVSKTQIFEEKQPFPRFSFKILKLYRTVAFLGPAAEANVGRMPLFSVSPLWTRVLYIVKATWNSVMGDKFFRNFLYYCHHVNMGPMGKD